jgi:hypothetical protein
MVELITDLGYSMFCQEPLAYNGFWITNIESFLALKSPNIAAILTSFLASVAVVQWLYLYQ